MLHKLGSTSDIPFDEVCQFSRTIAEKLQLFDFFSGTLDLRILVSSNGLVKLFEKTLQFLLPVDRVRADGIVEPLFIAIFSANPIPIDS